LATFFFTTFFGAFFVAITVLLLKLVDHTESVFNSLFVEERLRCIMRKILRAILRVKQGLFQRERTYFSRGCPIGVAFRTAFAGFRGLGYSLRATGIGLEK